MAYIKKRKLIGRASDFFLDQLEDLNKIAAETGTPRAVLIREGCDIVIKKYKKANK